MHQPLSTRSLHRPLALFGLIVVAVLCSVVLAPPTRALTSAGGGLYFQNAQPFSWRIGSLSFADADDLWAVAGNDSSSELVHSPDKGDTWRYVPVDLTADAFLSCLAFTDATHGRAVARWYDGASSRYRVALVKSDDGGSTWSTQSIKTGSFELLGAAFVSRDVAFVMGREYNATTKTWTAKLLRTGDGGTTWKRTRIGCPYPFDLAASDARHLWLYDSDTAKVWSSSDAGASWSIHALPLQGTSGSSFDVDKLQVVSAKVAWVRVNRRAKPHHLVMRTTDAGKTWKKISTYPDATEDGLAAVSASEAWLTVCSDSTQRDTSCYVTHTTDGGATWTRAYNGPRSLGVTAVGPDGTLYSAGRGIARSSDGGASWSRLIADDYEYWLNDVTESASGTLWAVGWTTPYSPGIYGDYDGKVGLIYRCSDGATWKQQDIPDGAVLSCVDFSGAENGWVAGLDGRVLRTSDGGASWSDCSAASSLDIYDIKALSPESAVAIAEDEAQGRCEVLLTTDAGATWSEHQTGSGLDVLKRISVLGSGHILIVGTRYSKVRISPKQGLLVESSDSGATWSERLLTDCTRTVRDMTFVDATHGWILASESASERHYDGDYGCLVLGSTDGGATWTSVDLGKVGLDGLFAVAFTDDEHGWVLGDKALTTSDGGATWTDSGAFMPSSALGQMFGEPVIRAAVTVGDDLWAVGADQVILSTVDTASDTVSPLTSDDGDRLWHNSAVTTHLFAADAGSGVASTEYRVDTGSWQTYSEGITVDAPADHSADGAHRIEYRSTDEAGNVEFTDLCTVHIDTCAPTTSAGGTVRVHRGSIAKLPFAVTDAAPNGGKATVAILVRDAAGKVVKRLRLSGQRVNISLTASFRCRLPIGAYSYEVTATDAAGNQQSSAGTGKLVVRRP